MTVVSPSILSADFANLRRDIEMLNESEAEMIHLDVMDGIFVPNISFGFPVIKAVARYARKTLDAHLMIEDPGRYLRQFRDCGVDIMNVHIEACNHLNRVVQNIRQAGMKAAVTLNPSSPVVLLEDIAADLDMVLLMSVNPGFAAQQFIPGTLDKITRLRRLLDETGSKALIQIDGGINATTGKACVERGADILVAGNYVFSDPDPAARISELRHL